MIRSAFLPPSPLPLSAARAPAVRRRRPTAQSTKTPARMDHKLSTVEGVEWLPSPIVVRGAVQHGLGRGSRDLGTPTANLAGTLLDGEQSAHRDGVYLGFGCVPSLLGGRVVKMVASLGRNITFDDVPARVLEAYLMAEYPRDFYGDEMRLVIAGFMRPEYKFDGIDELVKHIRNDVKVADAALDLADARPFSLHASLLS